MDLNHQVAIVTGGARGIGKAIANLFGQEGARISIVSRTVAEINNIVAEIKNNGGEAIGIVGDISNSNDVQAMVDKTISIFGSIDILVNNAGVQRPIGAFMNINMEEWINNLQTNLFGTVLCCKAVLPIMIKQRSGKIINLSGGGATSPRVNFSAYGIAKTAIVRFTETLAEELKDFNIQVNAIAPGSVNTQMLIEVLDAGEMAGKKEFEEAKKRAEQGGSSIKLAAELACFLASDRSNGLTGKLISAVWDDWKNFDRNTISQIMKTDKYTLRRIT